MTWGVTVDVPAPVDLYDRLHAALLERTGGAVDGLLLHLARATATGFQVIEVWESRADSERYEREVVGPLITEMTGGQVPSLDGLTEFEVRGLVLPGTGVAV
jgi:hypothetical protein